MRPLTVTRWNPFRKLDELEEMGSMSRWNPLREMEEMQGQIDKMFRIWPARLDLKETLTSAEWSPLVDIIEDEKEYLVKAEVPGVNKEDLKVTVEENVLKITGERKTEKEEKGKKYHRVERSYGSFERSFTLPRDAEAAKVSSEFKDGILRVHLPKNPTAVSKAVEVKVQ